MSWCGCSHTQKILSSAAWEIAQCHKGQSQGVSSSQGSRREQTQHIQTKSEEMEALFHCASHRQRGQHCRSQNTAGTLGMAARKELPRWHQEMWECSLFCLRKLPYTAQNKRRMGWKIPWESVLMLSCSLPAKPREQLTGALTKQPCGEHSGRLERENYPSAAEEMSNGLFFMTGWCFS